MRRGDRQQEREGEADMAEDLVDGGGGAEGPRRDQGWTSDSPQNWVKP